jgi:hypothetical protein
MPAGGSRRPATHQSHAVAYMSISGMIAMCEAMYATGCRFSQAAAKNSRDIAAR